MWAGKPFLEFRKLGNSFLCVLSKLSKNVLRFTVCAIIGKPKDSLLLGNSFQIYLRAGTCYFLTHLKTLELFFIES